MGVEAAAYQAGHSKVSMTRKHYIEEYKEALDARAVLDSFSPNHLAPPENQAVERGRAEH